MAYESARLSIGLIEDGTAIGDAIGVSLNRLREGAKDKTQPREGGFIVLLTDGASNKGSLDPRQAAISHWRTGFRSIPSVPAPRATFPCRSSTPRASG